MSNKKLYIIQAMSVAILTFSILGLCSNYQARAEPQAEESGVYYNSELIKDKPLAGSASLLAEIEPTPIPGDNLSCMEPEPELHAPDDKVQDIELLAHLIMGEAGDSRISDEHLYYVGSVALNRVADDDFPNTLKEVIYQKGQYACTDDGNFDKEPTDRCWEIAQELLDKGSILPDSVVYQSEFEQGSGVYKKIGNTYFCYK